MNSGWHTLGYTDSNGLVAASVLGGELPGRGRLQPGLRSDEQRRSTSASRLTFQTVKVTLLNSGPLDYAHNANSGWHSFTGPMQMFPGDYLLRDGHGNVTLTVGDSDFTGGIVRLVDHTGDGLPDGTASYYLGGWHSLPGQTDANGNLLFSIPNDSSGLSMGMTYGGTYNQQSRTQLGASNFTFQTALAVVKLEDADGNPLDTGAAQYYAGMWRDVGSGSTSGGQVSQEMLPGNYSFSMVYNHTREQLNSVAISGPTTDVVFQTGRLTAHFSEPFQWVTSQFYNFVQPTQEFLPGTINLDFEGCYVPLTIAAGDHLVKSGILAKLSDSGGHPLAGGVATAYAGGWKSVGTTDSHGRACAALDGTLGNTAVAMVYNGTRQQISQYQPTNSIYNFGTSDVTVQLEDSTGHLIDTGSASYYAGGWHTIGDTVGGQVDVQMLPGSYSFAMVYNGTRQQLNGVAVSGTSTTVTFQTTDVAQLLDTALARYGTASYYAGGWHTVGGTVDVEMLPGAPASRWSRGTRQQLNGVAVSGTSTTVTFQTTDVVAQLLDHLAPLDTGRRRTTRRLARDR